MDFIKNIFFDSDEQRLRSLIRFTIFLIIFIFFLVITQVIELALKDIFDYGKLITAPLSIVFFGLVLWIMSTFIDKRKMSGYGLSFNKEWIRDLMFGLFTGIFLITFVFILEYSLGWIKITKTFYVSDDKNFVLSMLESVLFFVYVGFYEEGISRGYMVKNFAEGMNYKKTGPAFAVIISVLFTSFLFGFGHANNPNATFIGWWNIIIIGVLFGYTFVLTKSIAIPIGIHITWNYFQGCVFGFPVSGNEVTVTFLKVEQGGNVLWTGGSFGPEAGLVIYFVAVLWLILLHIWLRFNKKSEKVDYKFAEYISTTSD